MKKLTCMIFLCLSMNISAQPGAFSLVSPANGRYVGAMPSFQWGAATGASSYRLFIDGVLKKDSITSTSYQLTSTESLAEPLHTWYIVAVDAASATTQSSQTFTIQIDATTPGAFNLISPSDASWTNSLLPSLQWAPSNDGLSGLKKYQLWVDGVLNRDNISPTLVLTTPVSALTNGSHTWFIKAIDSVGNVEASIQNRILKVDNIAPSSGTPDNVLVFDGISKYGRSTVFYNRGELPNTFTIECWFNTTSVQGGWLMGLGDTPDGTSGKRDRFIFMTNDGKIIFGVYSSGENELASKSGYNDGAWHHVAATLSTNGMKLYLDGILVDNNISVTTGYNAAVGYWKFGYDYLSDWNNCPTNNYFNGKMNEIRIWHIERTVNEISQWKDIPLVGNETGLYLYFPVRELDGNNTLTNYCSNNSFGGYLNNVSTVDASPLCSLKTLTNNEYTTDSLPTFSWGTTSDSGIGFQKFQLLIDDIIVKDNLSDSSFKMLTPLLYGQHKWCVKGFDLLGNNKTSSQRTFYIDNKPPRSFNLVTPIDSGIVTIPTPNLTWQSTIDTAGGCGLSKYQLWINGAKNVDSIPITATTTAPNSVLAEGTYTWFIKAFDKLGNVRNSTETRTFFVDYNFPNAFTIVTPAKGDTLKVGHPKFVWNKSIDSGSGIKQYVLRISGQIPDTISNADTSTVYTRGLVNGAYTWYVVAFDRGNNTKNSDTGSFVVNVQLPSEPLLASPVTASINQPVMENLKWFRAEGAESYHIQISTDSTFGSALVINTKGIVDTTYSVTTALLQNMHYYWRVNDTNTTGVSAWSDVWNFTTIPPIPSKVSIVTPGTVATITTDSVAFIWKKSTPVIDVYRLDISTDSLFSVLVYSDSLITDTTFIYKGLVNNKTYWCDLRAHNSAGWGPISYLCKLTVNIPAISVLPKSFGIKSFSFGSASGMLSYSLPVQCHVCLKYFDLKGRLIGIYVNQDQVAGYYNLILPVSTWAKGSYLLVFTAGNFIKKEKVTIVR